MSNNEIGLIDLRTMEIIIQNNSLIKDADIINGCTIEEDNNLFVVLQSKVGKILLLNIIMQKQNTEITFTKIKDIDLKIISFSKFLLNQIFYDENENFLPNRNNKYDNSLLIYPNYEESTLIFFRYIDEKHMLDVPFSKKNVNWFYLSNYKFIVLR